MGRQGFTETSTRVVIQNNLDDHDGMQNAAQKTPSA